MLLYLPSITKRYITPHDALIINEWRVGGFTRPRMPSIRGTAGAIQEVPRLLWGTVPGSELVTDKLDERKYVEQQKRIRKLGSLAAVDVLSLSRRRKDRTKLDLVLGTLRANGVFDHGRIVGIQPVIYSTAYRERRRVLSYRAEILSDAIDEEKEGGKTLFSARPIVVNSHPGSTSEALYAAIDEAAIDLNQKSKELTGRGEEGAYAPSPSLIIVLSAGHIATVLKGVTHDDMARSGVAVHELTDRLPKNNIWAPGFTTLPSDVRRNEGILPGQHVLVPELVPVPVAVQPYTSSVYA